MKMKLSLIFVTNKKEKNFKKAVIENKVNSLLKREKDSFAKRERIKTNLEKLIASAKNQIKDAGKMLDQWEEKKETMFSIYLNKSPKEAEEFSKLDRTRKEEVKVEALELFALALIEKAFTEASKGHSWTKRIVKNLDTNFNKKW